MFIPYENRPEKPVTGDVWEDRDCMAVYIYDGERDRFMYAMTEEMRDAHATLRRMRESLSSKSPQA